MKYFTKTLFLFLFIPNFVLASISISEIAWMGVSGTNGQYGEWLELYNNTDDAVDLSGWKLYSGGGSQLVFTLAKSIPAKSYFLIERTTASIPDPVPGVSDESGSFGGGGLSNSGEDLVLKDASGATVQNLSYGSGWPAGDTTTKETMQWDGTKWVTAPATPKAPYLGSGSPPPQNTSGSSSQDSRAPKNEPHIEFTNPSPIYKAVKYIFKARPVMEYSIPYQGSFRWNMGDGTYIEQSSLQDVEHIYQYPGNYTLSFAYYHNNYEPDPVISGTKVIEVLDPSLLLTKVTDQAIQIKNNTDKVVDLSGWQIVSTTISVPFPKMSLISPKANITILATTFGLKAFDTKGLKLVSPNGTTMATYGAVQSVSYQQPTVQGNVLGASANTAVVSEQISNLVVEEPKSKSNHAKQIIFGAVLLFVIVLAVILERFMRRREDLE